MRIGNKILMMASSAALAATFSACDSGSHAGVMSETESGKSIAGTIVTSLGTAAKASIYLVDSAFLALRDTVLYSATTDENGNFFIENVAARSYTVLIKNSTGESVAKNYVRIVPDSLESDTLDDNTVSLGTDTLSKASRIVLDISGFGLSAGDTLCLPGTFSCAVVSPADAYNGVVVLGSVPQDSFPELAKINTLAEDISVSWNIAAGSTYLATDTDGTLSAEATSLSRTLPDSLQARIALSQDSVPFPIRLSAEMKNPILIDENGAALPLEKTFASDDSVFYWAIAPKIDFSESTSQKLSVFSKTTESIPMTESPVRYALHWDSLATAGTWNGARKFSAGGSADTVEFFPFTDGNVAVSFWLQLGSDAFGSDSSVALFTALEDSLGLVIRQNRFNNYTSIGVELFVDADTAVISDTTLYGSAKILDGKWHHYAVLVRGHHLSVLLDGKVLQDTDFAPANGFGNPATFIVGDSRLSGSIDELKILSGKQDTTYLRTLYEFERPDQKPWTAE